MQRSSVSILLSVQFMLSRVCSWCCSVHFCIRFSEKVIVAFASENCQNTPKFIKLCVVSFIEESWSNSFNSESAGLQEFLPNASAQLIPDETLRPFANFLPEQLNLEGQWEVALSEVYPSMHQNVREKIHVCSWKIVQNRQNCTILNPVFNLPLRLLVKPWKFCFKRDNQSKVVSQSKYLEKR